MEKEKKESIGERIKSFVALLTALCALIAALGSFIKSDFDPMTEQVYLELTSELRKINDENQRQSENINRLQTTLEIITHIQNILYYDGRLDLRIEQHKPAPNTFNSLTHFW